MSTRSRIARQNSDGTVTSIYCHSNGYLEGVGATLFEHYQDAAKVDELLALGDISILGDEIGEKHDFDWASKKYREVGDWGKVYDDPRNNWCRVYGRDRGEEGTQAKTHHSAKNFWSTRQHSWAEYQYLFDNGTWYVKQYDADVELLKDALGNRSEQNGE